MSQYYYAVASLPAILYNSEIIPEESYFFDVVINSLDENGLGLINRLKSYNFDILEKFNNELLDKYINWEITLRNELAKARGKKLSSDPSKYLRDSDNAASLVETASQAVSSESPLVAEDILNKKRWDVLDELETGHFFDLEKVIVYYLKLKILNRKKQLNKAKGISNFNSIFDGIKQKNINSDNFIGVSNE